jgi:hypothetical protein
VYSRLSSGMVGYGYEKWVELSYVLDRAVAGSKMVDDCFHIKLLS